MFQAAFSLHVVGLGALKACPHLFPKTATLYPETGNFVAFFRNKIACLRIQSCRFREQVWTGLNVRQVALVWLESRRVMFTCVG